MIDVAMAFVKPNLLRVLQRQVTFADLPLIARFSSYNACQLVNRSVIQIEGVDSYKCLQGLITNDIRCLYSDQIVKSPRDCLYSFVLHPTGKVLADIFLYDKDKASTVEHSESDSESIAAKRGKLFIECDDRSLEKLNRHLRFHILRKDVTFKVVDDMYIWSIFPSAKFESENLNTASIVSSNDRSLLVDDPRIQNHYRIIADKTNAEMLLDKFSKKHKLDIKKVSHDDYTNYRCLLGIGEGYDDHPNGKCFPLESNGDYLNAISFAKGCYVGQELTARTYHTGVIRKRLVPIKLMDKFPDDLRITDVLDKEIYTYESEKRIGKLRSFYNLSGLGLILVEKLNPSQPIKCYIKKNNHIIHFEAIKPTWWPEKGAN